MKYLAALLAVLFLTAGAAYGQRISIHAPNRAALVEGEDTWIKWDTDRIKTVSIVARGRRTPLGRTSRGDFQITVAQNVPTSRGEVRWKVPWIDAGRFFVKVKGYDRTGKQVAASERAYGFRPAVLAKRQEDGLYLDLHERKNQRLYVQKNYRITYVFLSSSSENYDWRARNSHVKSPHDHAGVFHIIEKKRLHHSVLFDVPMPFAMRYHGGHFVHATSSNLYRDLGRPASHGCNRLTRYDAQRLFRMTPTGTRIEVIGPEG